jgi:hypothetical protein
MGRDLHPTILSFFLDRMAEHTIVVSCTPLPNDDDYLFEVARRCGMAPVLVHLSDAYRYGEVDYLTRPSQLKRGSFIIVAKPEGDYAEELVNQAREDGIGLGNIGKFMGALNRREVWKYESPEERERSKRERNR